MSKRDRPDQQEQALQEALASLASVGVVDLTARARAGKLPRAYGRDREVEEVLAALLDRRSVLLLGPSGVGKTAVLHEVVNRVAQRQAPPPLQDRHFVQTSTPAIESGAQNTGMWAGNLGSVVEALRKCRQLCLFLENIWDLRDAGRYTGETQSFATYLRPYLAQRQITLLGESTPELYARLSVTGAAKAFALAGDPSLVACFHVVTLAEPEPSAVRAILSSVALALEGKTALRVSPAALERSVELTQRFQPYQAMPGKAVRLLGEVARELGHDGPAPATGADPAAGGEARAPREATADDVTAAFSRLTGLPPPIISDRVSLSQAAIRAYFSERVVGQPGAVNTVVDLVTLIKAELHDPSRPLGVLLFVGPTGTGKTLLARTLAEYLFGSERKLIRFDMSEYKLYDSLPGLTEQLVEKVQQESFSVVLLDEVEKAAPQVFDLFLQAFGDARLSDPAGRVVDLRNTIFVMTSNLRAEVTRTGRVGFGPLRRDEPPEESGADEPWLRAVHEFFRPEFVNRLDHIVVFHTLGLEHMRQIARRELSRSLLRGGVTRRSILLDFRDEVLEVLLRAGFSETYGARPLQRAIRELVLLPLARRIAAHPAEGEQLLELHARAGRIELVPIPLGPPAAAPYEAALAEPELPSGQPTCAAAGAAPLRGLSLDELAAAIAQIQARLVAQRDSDHHRALAAWSAELLDATSRPGYWDDPVRARSAYEAIYHLERVTDLLAKLLSRAEALAEVPTLIRRHRDSAGLPRLERRYRELEREADLLELELLALTPSVVPYHVAFVCTSPVTAPRAREPGDWPGCLHAMYAAWARLKGYSAEVVSEPGAREYVLLVRGPGVDRMLQGEEGIHKRQLAAEAPADRAGGESPRARVQLARVEVLAVAAGAAYAEQHLRPGELLVRVLRELPPASGGGEPRQHVEALHEPSGLRVAVQARDASAWARLLLGARLARKSGTSDAAHRLARVYSVAGTAYVRDTRTGYRHPRPREVLAGDLDDFLLAHLRPRSAG